MSATFDMTRFLSRVLPWHSDTYIGVHHKGAHGFPGKPCCSAEEAARAALYWNDPRRRTDVYVSMGALRDVEQRMNGEGRSYSVSKREGSNGAAWRGLWLDIDVKPDKPDEAYRTHDEARAAFDAFVIDAGLPQPTALVASGSGGLHAHFVLDTAISGEVWEPLAHQLVACAKRHGLKIDQQCTTDRVRLMRVPGTWNCKPGGPYPVQLLYLAEESIALADMQAALASYPARGAQRPASASSIVTADDVLLANYKHGWWDDLSDDAKDAALTEMLAARSDLASGGYEGWRNALMTAARSGAPNAEAIARDWSAQDARHTDAEFDKIWTSIGPGEPGQISIGWLIHAAKAQGLDAATRYAGADAEADASGASVEVLPPKHNSGSKYARTLEILSRIGVVAARDTFRNVVTIDNAPGANVLACDHCGALGDGALIFLRALMSARGFDPGNEALHDAVLSIAEANRFNSAVQWLDGLSWDGVPRLGTWLPQITGAAATPLNGAVGGRLIGAIVTRARYPGTKFDICVVFEGAQGVGKSSLARMLALGQEGEHFCDAPGLIALQDKDRAGLLAGKSVVELGELAGLGKRDVEGIKAFISLSADQYRKPYAREPIDQPRTCVFVGTTNSTVYLSDATGNRRFMPVRCGNIGLHAFRQMREQLFAEAHHKLSALVATLKTSGWQIEDGRSLPHGVTRTLQLPRHLWDAAAEVVEDRRIADERELWLPEVMAELEKKATALSDGRRFVKAQHVLQGLEIRIGRQQRPHGLPEILQHLGWEATRLRIGGERERGFAKL
jgi:hypothetical protein